MRNGERTDCGVRLLAVVVDRGLGSRVLRLARKNGIAGGTILLAAGVGVPWAPAWADPADEEKDLVLMVAGPEALACAVPALDRAFRFSKPYRGVAFHAPLSALSGTTHCTAGSSDPDAKEVAPMFQAVVTIVDKGLAETVVEAAESAGAHGATIVNARGAGVHETARLFSMDVEPEREVVLVLAAEADAEAIRTAICRAACLDEPGRGLLFSLPVKNACGLGG